MGDIADEHREEYELQLYEERFEAELRNALGLPPKRTEDKMDETDQGPGTLHALPQSMREEGLDIGKPSRREDYEAHIKQLNERLDEAEQRASYAEKDKEIIARSYESTQLQLELARQERKAMSDKLGEIAAALGKADSLLRASARLNDGLAHVGMNGAYHALAVEARQHVDLAIGLAIDDVDIPF